MYPPADGYDYWRRHHSDCELVHVMWTDYCGILHEKLMPVESFDNLRHWHVQGFADSDSIIELTVTEDALLSLPDGQSAAERVRSFYETCDLEPDYDTIQPCFDSRTRATVFATVQDRAPDRSDPREVLKAAKISIDPRECSGWSLEFQFVLRSLCDGQVHLPRSDGPAQVILQRLVGALHANGRSPRGPSIRSSGISMNGVVTIALSMSDTVLEAVDNYYRIKRGLQSIASTEGLRPSFFYPSEDVPGAPFSGTPFDVMCKNRLHCRLYLDLASEAAARSFAVNVMGTFTGATAESNPSIYAFCRPNWLTYGQRDQYLGDPSPKREWMTWGIRNPKTTINFPDGEDSGRLEFGDIDCMANMYLVVAGIVDLGTTFPPPSPESLDNIPPATNVAEYDPSAKLNFPENQRIPLTGVNACRGIRPSALPGRSCLGQIMPTYLAVRKMEDEIIVKAVEEGRATSARELLGTWY